MIRNIVGETGTWRIKIKPIYQWKTYEQNGEVNGTHTILIDEEGTRIQAIISKYVLSAHQDKIKEGEHYYITRNCNDITIPADRFNFPNFNDILALKYDTTVLTDIIAEVIAYSNVNDGFKLSINLELIDEEFWEQYAEEIYSYLSKPENNKSFVIIIQYAKVKLWRGTTSLTNSMFITRLTIEPDIHEVHEFKNRRKLNDGLIIQRSLLDESNHSLKSSELIFLHNHEAVQLKDIVLLQKSYSSCYKCFDAVQKESDGSMSCLTCKVPILIVWPRYKIFVRVSDGVGQFTFVLFDSQVKKELQVTAKELIDTETFPEELEKLINKIKEKQVIFSK
ncbi:uncharacterized protein LOC130821525 [Amaranthus tricolor]|uniref:uncharacterized protein LOC130821525 n=1 Tax=Amaranthus tricolor TaxID=29722 RepID=UPI0025890098|nr:uncharacterized protein LOC130821525 [Amaranthus tricolor]